MNGAMQKCGQCGWPHAKVGGECGMATFEAGAPEVSARTGGKRVPNSTVQYIAYIRVTCKIPIFFIAGGRLTRLGL